MVLPNVDNVFDKLNAFVNKTSGYLQSWSGQYSGKSEDPDDYTPRKNLECIEQIMIQDDKLFQHMLRLEKKLGEHQDNKDMQKELTISYANVLLDMIDDKNDK